MCTGWAYSCPLPMLPHAACTLGCHTNILLSHDAVQRENIQDPTSITSWWARDTSVSPLLWLKVSEMSWPKVYPAPRGEMPHPPLSSGSDHSKSHMGPWHRERTWSKFQPNFHVQQMQCKSPNKTQWEKWKKPISMIFIGSYLMGNLLDSI